MAVAVHATEAKRAEEEPLKTRQEVLATLPCFECHSVDRFMAEPEAGVFSHSMHGMMSGLHCNQCHDIKGHDTPTLKGGSCGQCHSTETITYSGGGMGKVAFGHAAHTAMFSCQHCHPGPFKMKKGGVRMTMAPMSSPWARMAATFAATLLP